MSTPLALLGVCMGCGLVLTVAGFIARQPSLAEEMRRYGRGAAWTTEADHGGEHGLTRALASVARELERLVASDRLSRQARDLAITDRTLERHVVVMAVSVLAGVFTPIVLGGSLAALGWHLPVLGVLALAGLGATGGVVCPTIELRRSAAHARHRFLRGLSCWLELVALAQAGGMGVESALEAASRISPDAGFTRIRGALERSRHSGVTPWQELGRLGSEIGVDELDELAASLALAGSEGARIRASLRAKSESLHRRQMSEAQSHANSTTERLFLPSIVLMMGFLVFLMFPAGVSLTHVL